MKVSRAPENRGGSNKLWLYLGLVTTVVTAGIIVTYFTVGFESLFATGDETGLAASPTAVAPVMTPAPAEVPEPMTEPSHLPIEPKPSSRAIPDVDFGEVLAEGEVNLDLPGDVSAESWYTFQVNTSTGEITLFFALYSNLTETIIRTVKIEGYSQHGNPSSAEVTLFYPEGPERVIIFDGKRGVISLSQEYEQPYGPSLFSPGLRVAMVKQNMELADETGTITAQVQFDLSGLSDSEHIFFERSDPQLVNMALAEIQTLVQQIELKRGQ